MSIRPKRRKSKDNPYTLEHIDSDKTYYVYYVDGNNKMQRVKISKTIYDALDRFELDDLKELNEYDRHTEHNEVYEYRLYLTSNYQIHSVEDVVEQAIIIEKLYEAISSLPPIQKKRIKMYYFDNMPLREIAKLEGCNYIAIKFSIDNAVKNLRKILKNQIRD